MSKNQLELDLNSAKISKVDWENQMKELENNYVKSLEELKNSYESQRSSMLKMIQSSQADIDRLEEELKNISYFSIDEMENLKINDYVGAEKTAIENVVQKANEYFKSNSKEFNFIVNVLISKTSQRIGYCFDEDTFKKQANLSDLTCIVAFCQ